jgi:ribose/xylose/arabinose/galactoside ABC-type transport system permease subunit
MPLGRLLIALGLLVAALGVLISLGERLPIRLGRSPGDIIMRGKHSVFYFPLVTCVLISAVLSLVLWFMNRR